jgi:predicted amidophosphoribosyltransferase
MTSKDAERSIEDALQRTGLKNNSKRRKLHNPFHTKQKIPATRVATGI